MNINFRSDNGFKKKNRDNKGHYTDGPEGEACKHKQRLNFTPNETKKSDKIDTSVNTQQDPRGRKSSYYDYQKKPKDLDNGQTREEEQVQGQQEQEINRVPQLLMMLVRALKEMILNEV